MKTTILASLVALALGPLAEAQCIGDIAVDGRVDGGDLGVLLANWGPVTSTALSHACDLDGNGQVNGADLGLVLSNWGTCPTVLTEVVPNIGVVQGGATVRICGQFLTGVQTVRFGSNAAPSFAVSSDSELLAVTPPGVPGTVNVVVSGPRGTATIQNGFTYQSIITPQWATLVQASPDPSVVTNSAVRQAIAATGLAWRVRDTATQIEMLLIPPGTFLMGCTSSLDWICWSGSVTRQVTLTRAYYVSRSEVTQSQWQAAMGANPSRFQGASYPSSALRPVEHVSRDMLLGFLAATDLRLLTEAEWEYACRAGTSTAFHGWSSQPDGTSNDSLVGEVAWYVLNSHVPLSGLQTHPVSTKAPNGFGLHDMLGNVWEWVADNWSVPSGEPQTDPTGPPKGLNGVIRGGAWDFGTNVVSSGARDVISIAASRDNLGFRVAKSP